MARDEAYRNAEEMIREALRWGWTELNPAIPELDLSGRGLSELPESLEWLADIRELDISNNPLAVLPEWLGGLTTLESLNLSRTELKELPQSLGQLKQLKTLNLSYNQLRALPNSLQQLTQLQTLDLNSLSLRTLPRWLTSFTRLQSLELGYCPLTKVPFWLGHLKQLHNLSLAGQNLRALPESLRSLTQLRFLNLNDNDLARLPEWLGELTLLVGLSVGSNRLLSLPSSFVQLECLQQLNLNHNRLNPELHAAYKEGLDAVKGYLRAKTQAQVALNEAKLILIGEGEVGKSCLLSALRGDGFVEGQPTTHGIEIKPVSVIDPDTGTEITLNGWDFGGQRVYRPTHQLFFSAPAVYLVVWKPREGQQQGFVKEWIKLVKHREPDAKILVVATHGGPSERQPDIGKQELWDLFGQDTVLDFFHVDSRPNEETGERGGIPELKDAIARVAASLPEMGRAVPARWQQARVDLKQKGVAYLPLEQVLDICRELKMAEDEARDFVRISHRLGHLIHYEHDPVLQDIVVLKPDWLTTAISFVLDDKQTRDSHGLVSFDRLSQLWNDPAREKEFRYPPDLHPVFLRLMERFDLSYRVAGLRDVGQDGATSLIAQLVPDDRPDPVPGWVVNAAEGDEQQVQICQIVETKNGQSAAAEGLFYQLIVRLHKYSMGRVNYKESVHWQRGLVLDDDYNGRALLEHVGNDVRITVRAAYPEGLLSVLTHEVKWLVESFWAGLRCDVMVPCIEPCGKNAPGTGLFEVQKLIESKKRRRPEYPCSVCNEWHGIDQLLRNAPAAQRIPAQDLLAGLSAVKGELSGVRELLIGQHGEALGRFDGLDVSTQRILSKVDDAYIRLMQTLADEGL